jgi:flavin-dependent dehydrogenase
VNGSLKTDCDVAIIGGGPGGSTVATFLAKEGFSVRVFEKERFPRFHIGESLLPYNTPILEELGVLPEIERAGFMTKNGAQFFLGDGSRSTKFRFRDGSFTKYPSAFQVERSKFDEILLNHAEKCGATVSHETAVAKMDVDRDLGATLTWQQKDGSTGTTSARFVIDASGVVNFSGNRQKLREDHPHLRKVAVFGHFNGVAMPQGDERGDILIVRLKEAWCWLIPLSETKTSVGLVFDNLAIRGTEPEALFHETTATHSELHRRVARADLIGKLHAITDFSYSNREIVSDRLVRVGDAAGFLDPIFSSGVYLAMVGGRDGAKATMSALRADRTLTLEMRRYEHASRKNMRLYREMIEKFYSPDLMEVLMSPRRFFRVPEAVNAILAGRLDGSWSVHWRLRLFYLLVWIQRRRPFLPRIPALR